MAAFDAGRRLLLLKNHIGSSDIIQAKTSSKAAQDVLETRRTIPILGSYMSYLDTKEGDNVVIFIHGNPTSAYMWRNIIPHVQRVARCVAPDLIGMGHSGKPEMKYRFVEHYEYLSEWIEKMDFPGKITVVCHDWGSGLGFHWCFQHQERVRALVHMESLIGVIPDWQLFPEIFRDMFQALRTDAGEEMNLRNNHFIEHYLPENIIRKLTDEEMTEYRAPYKDSEKSRLPTLTWPREIPVATEGPDDVIALVHAYSAWLAEDTIIPKLYINADPGLFSSGISWVVESWFNQKSITVKGLHFLQEDSPNEIGLAIKKFLVDI